MKYQVLINAKKNNLNKIRRKHINLKEKNTLQTKGSLGVQKIPENIQNYPTKHIIYQK